MPKYTLKASRSESNPDSSQSQSSNFDGNEEAMEILLKAQASAAKNKKQRENQHLSEAKEELSGLLEAGARDYGEAVIELEKLYQAFQMKLAASHDREGKYWTEAVAEQARFKNNLDEIVQQLQEAGETREKAQIEALAKARLSMKDAQTIISKNMLV